MTFKENLCMQGVGTFSTVFPTRTWDLILWEPLKINLKRMNGQIKIKLCFDEFVSFPRTNFGGCGTDHRKSSYFSSKSSVRIKLKICQKQGYFRHNFSQKFNWGRAIIWFRAAIHSSHLFSCQTIRSIFSENDDD